MLPSAASDKTEAAKTKSVPAAELKSNAGPKMVDLLSPEGRVVWRTVSNIQKSNADAYLLGPYLVLGLFTALVVWCLMHLLRVFEVIDLPKDLGSGVIVAGIAALVIMAICAGLREDNGGQNIFGHLTLQVINSDPALHEAYTLCRQLDYVKARVERSLIEKAPGDVRFRSLIFAIDTYMIRSAAIVREHQEKDPAHADAVRNGMSVFLSHVTKSWVREWGVYFAAAEQGLTASSLPPVEVPEPRTAPPPIVEIEKTLPFESEPSDATAVPA